MWKSSGDSAGRFRPGLSPGRPFPLHDIPGLRDQRERSDQEKQQPYRKGPCGYCGNAGLEYVVESGFHVRSPWLYSFTILALIHGVVAGGDEFVFPVNRCLSPL